MKYKLKTSIVEISGYFLVALSVYAIVGSMAFMTEDVIRSVFCLMPGVLVAFAAMLLLKWERRIENVRTVYVKRFDYKVLLVIAILLPIAALMDSINISVPVNPLKITCQLVLAIVFLLSSMRRKDRYRKEDIERILVFLKDKKEITIDTLVEDIGFSSKTAKCYLRELCVFGHLESNGDKHNRTYTKQN